MDISFSCVPVTALHRCYVDGRRVLLAGQGSSLCIYDCDDKQVILRSRVFASQTIHGMCTRPTPTVNTEETTAPAAWVFIWAGNAAALLCLKFVGSRGESRCRESMLMIMKSFTVELHDWALFGDFLESDRADLLSAYVLTAHNEVHEIVLDEGLVTNSQNPSCKKILSGPGCVLYSAHARCTSTGLLVAAGTVFGEVVIWSADKNEVSETWSWKILNVFLGHKGSIFGICVLEDHCPSKKQRRLLATCSDDRTIRIWNIDGGAQVGRAPNTQISHPRQLSDVTGFGDAEENSSSLLATAWGHLSRIWSIKFLPRDPSSKEEKISLVSTGEDASICVWEAAIDGINDNGRSESVQLREITSYMHHSGKNIWSSDHCYCRGKFVHYSGGADGSIVATTLRTTTEPIFDFHTSMSFNQISNQLEVVNEDSTVDLRLPTPNLKQYAFTGDGSILATTTQGDVVLGTLEEEHREIVWRTIHSAQSRTPPLLCSDRESGSVFFAIAGGTLLVIKQGSNKILYSSIDIPLQATFMCVISREAFDAPTQDNLSILIPLSQARYVILVSFLIAESIQLVSSAGLTLPAGFIPTSGCHYASRGLLLLGSRSGSIAIFEISGDSSSLMAVFSNLHGSDTVTSFLLLNDGKMPTKQVPAEELFILTTGRDGTYGVHKISRKPAHSDSPMLQTVHRSSPRIGPNIEGAYLARSAVGQKSDLVLYGFKSTEFMVWNETQQTEMLSVDCGGAHRSWSYSPSKDGPSGQNLYGGTFVWTKAGACHVYRKSAGDHHQVQSGGHGREIKAVAVSPIALPGEYLGCDEAVLFATGAEDTTIRLFAVDARDQELTEQSEDKKMKCIVILNRHTTGIHHLQFSACGKYLFSSGGCEELFVWRLQIQIPVVGVGVVLECTLPKTEIDVDARITCFKVNRHAVSEAEAGMNFNVTATYSNGKVKLFKYLCEQDNRKGNFQLQQEIIEGSYCLTQVHHVLKDNILLTTGTNGFINVHFPLEWNFVWKHRIHQNSIQSSVIFRLHRFSPTWLVVTGGDDNALGLTVFCPDMISSIAHGSAFRTLLIPNAHAAAVTGLTILSKSRTKESSHVLTFVSVSDDQKVKVWRVTVPLGGVKESVKDEIEMGDITIEKVAQCWTSVADAAAAEILKSTPRHKICGSASLPTSEEASQELLVIGVGMEILRIPPQSLYDRIHLSTGDI